MCEKEKFKYKVMYKLVLKINKMQIIFFNKQCTKCDKQLG